MYLHNTFTSISTMLAYDSPQVTNSNHPQYTDFIIRKDL